MKHLILTTIAAVVLVGCGPSIHDAVLDGNIEAVKQHIADGVDVNAKAKGWTPLLYAAVALGDQKEIVKLLIASGADVNAKDKSGKTPLHEAAGIDNKEVAKLLVAAGADVNAKDGVGVTPLHWAAWGGHKETAELLISKGADVNAKNEKGEAPLDWANDPNWPNATAKTANLLRKHGGKTSTAVRRVKN